MKFMSLSKKEIAKFESVSKWIKAKLYQHVVDDETMVKFDGEDHGFVDMEFTIDDMCWGISLVTSGGDKYGIACHLDCEDMTITEIKNDLRGRIEVMKPIEWCK